MDLPKICKLSGGAFSTFKSRSAKNMAVFDHQLSGKYAVRKSVESSGEKDMKLAGLGAAYALLRPASETRSKASEERQAKRLGEMQDAIKRLQAMPTPKQIAKQDSMSRVAMLKKRLDALKSMLLHASPEQARALARELKSIAKELSSVAKSLGGGPQGAASAPAGAEVATGPTDVAGSASPDAQATASATTESAAVEAASGASDTAQVNEAQAKTAADAATSSPASPADDRQAGQAEGDGDLRAMLQDAKKLLKEVIAMLKAKMALAANQARASKEEKQANLDLQSAEKSLADIEKSLSRGGSELYSAQGDLGISGAGDGFAASVSISGLNVNVAA
jgi:hypothetical protein